MTGMCIAFVAFFGRWQTSRRSSGWFKPVEQIENNQIQRALRCSHANKVVRRLLDCKLHYLLKTQISAYCGAASGCIGDIRKLDIASFISLRSMR